MDSLRIMLLLSGAGQGLQQGQEGMWVNSGQWVPSTAAGAAGCLPALGGRSAPSKVPTETLGARLRPGSRMEGGDTAAGALATAFGV